VAQTTASSVEARPAQFVLILDDSGSMQKTDPDRLAVFAVRSLLSLLDDRDEVSIVRLNGPAGEAPPIEPLGSNRQTLLRRLDLGGELAGYQGSNTTCRSALGVTKGLLAQAHRSGVAQVVLVLTDGECTPASEMPDADGFLQGLASQEEGLFQLHLLRFGREKASPGLLDLARRTGGGTVDVGSNDPSAILHAFAAALSRSQGYEAELVTPSDPRISAHRGAKRVRLLAVAPGEGPALGLSLSGNAPEKADAGTHRFGSSRTYRYAFGEYVPGTEPKTLVISGAKDWKVVVLPEYRLSIRMKVVDGGCDGKTEVQDHVDVGATVCFQVELVADGGQVVSGADLGGELQAFLASRKAGEPAAEPLPMTQEGSQARFHLEQSRMEKGTWIFQPSVRLAMHGRDTTLRGPGRTIQVATLEIAAAPPELQLGDLLPGQEKTAGLTLQGNFPQLKVRLDAANRRDLPACVTFGLNSQPEGRAFTISPRAYTLALRVAPWCGPSSFRQPFSTRLRLLDEGGRSLLEIPVSFSLDYRVQLPEALRVKVRGGDEATVEIPLHGNWRRQPDLRMTLEPSGPVWPEELRLDLRGAALRVRPHPCCAAGTYEGELHLAPPPSDEQAKEGGFSEPAVVPVTVEVEAAGVWACYGWWILRGLALLLLILLLLYLINMVRNSRFLKPLRVAEKLVPLTWTAHGSTVPIKDHRARVLEMVRGALPWHRRALAWLQANPLAFGLPGGAYRETLELGLQPHRDVTRSTAGLLSRRRFPEVLAKDPAAYAGRLFAVAEGGATFLAVPDKEGRVGRMSLDGAAPPDSAKRPLVRLRGQKLLRHPESWEPTEGVAAGWQVG
jgi:Mg-chelatase subunit ChlD